MLEVHWISILDEIRANHDRLREEFEPTGFHDLTPDLQRSLDAINRRLDEAWTTLSNDQARRDYRKKVVEGFMIAQSAELLAKKGDMAIMRHDRREAMTCFAKALELVPGQVEYREGLRRAATAG